MKDLRNLKHYKKLRELPSKFAPPTMIAPKGADPWVIYEQGSYYYCRTYEDTAIMVNKASCLEDIGLDNHIVWHAPIDTPEAEVWAPELHRVRGKWYIYFTMGKGENHRMYVLEGRADDPQGEYEFKGLMSEQSDQWAIDNTVFEWKDKWYCVWSGWETRDNKIQNLYIAPMKSPYEISGERVCISRPVYQWEKVAGDFSPVNEGPEALVHGNKMFIIYSASQSTTDDYCLGQLELVGDDPLLPTSWIKKPVPVFSKYGSIFGPGHASFIEKPDGSDWIIYHSTSESEAGWDARLLRAQRFSWHKDGSPNFGKPLARDHIRILERFRKKKK